MSHTTHQAAFGELRALHLYSVEFDADVQGPPGPALRGQLERISFNYMNYAEVHELWVEPLRGCHELRELMIRNSSFSMQVAELLAQLPSPRQLESLHVGLNMLEADALERILAEPGRRRRAHGDADAPRVAPAAAPRPDGPASTTRRRSRAWRARRRGPS